METVYCVKLSCSLSPAACVLRQQKAGNIRGGRTTWGANGRVWQQFPQCVDCEQGREVAKDAHPKSKAAKSTQPVSIKQNNGEPAMERQICQDPECPAGDKPQPISAFQVHGPSGKPMRYCRACMARRNIAGRRAKTHGALEKKQRPMAENEVGALADVFSGHESVLDQISQLAKAELRTVRAQVVFAVITYIKGGGR